MKTLPRFIALALAAATLGGYAQGQSMSGMDGNAMPAMKDKAMVSGQQEEGRRYHARGTIRKMDAQRKWVTIAHGPIPDLSWPAMTMTFAVQNSKLLDRFKAGDFVGFELVATGKDGQYAIVRIEPAD